jgi:hypothetical protein
MKNIDITVPSAVSPRSERKIIYGPGVIPSTAALPQIQDEQGGLDLGSHPEREPRQAINSKGETL